MSADTGSLHRYPPLPLTPIIAERMTEVLQVWPHEFTLDNLPMTRVASDEQHYARTIEEHVGQRPFDYFERDIAGPS
jgi:hypothetical protein